MDKNYLITELNFLNLSEALNLVWKVFLEFEAPDYCEEGVQEFKEYIEYESIKDKLLQSKLRMWTCECDNIIIGVLAVRLPCHISLLFVDKKHHKKGIARAMLNHMTEYYRNNTDFFEITVNSSPYAQEIYHKLGFCDTNAEQIVNGIRFIPMKRPLCTQCR